MKVHFIKDDCNNFWLFYAEDILVRHKKEHIEMKTHNKKDINVLKKVSNIKL